MLIIIFGQMGMGKSFVGKILARTNGITFFEGDSAIPPGENLVSNSAVDAFVKVNLITAIDEQLTKNNNNLVVSYAFYREEHRRLIQDYFCSKTDVVFIHIKTSFHIQIQNLSMREHGYIKWIPFALLSRVVAFEKPKLMHFEIEHHNGGEKEILETLRVMPFIKICILQKQKLQSKRLIPREMGKSLVFFLK